MSLSVALNAARSALSTTSAEIAVSGRNVAGADDPTYARRIALPVSTADGGARIVTVTRATDTALFERVVSGTAAAADRSALLAGLDRLHAAIGDTDSERSPAAMLSAFANALQAHANAPDDRLVAQQAVSAAGGLARSLNAGAEAVRTARQQADADIGAAVGRVNDMLSRFAGLNTTIVDGSAAGADVTTEMDQRDAIIAELAGEVGLSVSRRSGNDIALYTDSGVPLFDRTPRTVSFAATGTYAAGTVGNAVIVDGVPVTGPASPMPVQSGSIFGLATFRDEAAPIFQAQLDALAGSLVAAFAETSTSASPATAAGLFTYASGPALPAGDTGLAASIRVAAAVDPQQGGDVSLLRDGGIAGAAYGSNATGAAGYSGRLTALVGALSATRTVDAGSALASPLNAAEIAAGSAGWLAAARQDASTASAYQETLLSRASDALSNATGVSLDAEYAKQLQLEQSYAASAKLIGVVGKLFDTLFAAIA